MSVRFWHFVVQLLTARCDTTMPTKLYMAAINSRPIISANKLSIIKVIPNQIHWHLCISSVGICTECFVNIFNLIFIRFGSKLVIKVKRSVEMYYYTVLSCKILLNDLAIATPPELHHVGKIFRNVHALHDPLILWKILFIRFKMIGLIY